VDDAVRAPVAPPAHPAAAAALVLRAEVGVELGRARLVVAEVAAVVEVAGDPEVPQGEALRREPLRVPEPVGRVGAVPAERAALAVGAERAARVAGGCLAQRGRDAPRPGEDERRPRLVLCGRGLRLARLEDDVERLPGAELQLDVGGSLRGARGGGAAGAAV